MNKHQQKTEATKGKLLKAARRIFARDGFEASRIDDIVKLAGYTRGAFYAHFATKEELFLALLQDQSARKVEQLRALLSAEPDDAARLNILREFYANSVTDQSWSILMLEFKLYALRHVKERKKLTEAHRRIRSGIKFESLAGLMPRQFSLEYRKKGEDSLRYAFEALLQGLVLQEAYDPDSLSRSQAKLMLRRCFDALVDSAPPAKSPVLKGSITPKPQRQARAPLLGP